jgi:excisionase family DNA binding protein
MPEKYTYKSRELFPPPQEEITMRDVIYLVLEMHQQVEIMTKLVKALNEKKMKQNLNQENKTNSINQKSEFEMNRIILNSDWMTTKEVMQLLKLSKRTIQNYRNEGKIPFKKFNGRIYYSRSEIEKHMNIFVVKKKE